MEPRSVPVQHDKARINDQRKVHQHAAGEPPMGVRPTHPGAQKEPKRPSDKLAGYYIQARDVPMEEIHEADLAEWNPFARMYNVGQPVQGNAVAYMNTPKGLVFYHVQDGHVVAESPPQDSYQSLTARMQKDRSDLNQAKAERAAMSINPHKVAQMKGYQVAKQQGWPTPNKIGEYNRDIPIVSHQRAAAPPSPMWPSNRPTGPGGPANPGMGAPPPQQANPAAPAAPSPKPTPRPSGYSNVGPVGNSGPVQNPAAWWRNKGASMRGAEPTAPLRQSAVGNGGVPGGGSPGAPPGAGASPASVPFMITNAMKDQLRAMGWTDAQIRMMKPQQAHDALAGKKPMMGRIRQGPDNSARIYPSMGTQDQTLKQLDPSLTDEVLRTMSPQAKEKMIANAIGKARSSHVSEGWRRQAMVGDEPRIPVSHVLKQIKAMGMVAKWDRDSEEFIVNYPGGREATAHYTPWAEDAIGTAQAMADRRNQQQAPQAEPHINQYDQGPVGPNAPRMEAYPDTSYERDEPSHSSRIGSLDWVGHMEEPQKPALNREFMQARELHIERIHEQANEEIGAMLDRMAARMGVKPPVTKPISEHTRRQTGASSHAIVRTRCRWV